jgi:predicted DNA repair protein MutK
MPFLLTWLSRIGTAAMLWVGGHILLVGTDELGWHGPHDVVHDIEHVFEDVPLAGIVEWLVNTAASAVLGLAVGLLAVAVVSRLPKRNTSAAS